MSRSRIFKPVDNRRAFAFLTLLTIPLGWMAQAEKAQRGIDLDTERIRELRDRRALNALREAELAQKVAQAHNKVVVQDLEIERLQLQNLAMRRGLGLPETGEITEALRTTQDTGFTPTVWGPGDPLVVRNENGDTAAQAQEPPPVPIPDPSSDTHRMS